MPGIGGVIRVRTEAAGLGITLSPAAAGVVGLGGFRGLPHQLIGFEPRSAQECLQLIGGERDRVPCVRSLDAHLDRGGTGPQMGNALRTQITLQVGRSWMQVVSVAIWELEPDGRLGWHVDGSRGRHDDLRRMMAQPTRRDVNRP